MTTLNLVALAANTALDPAIVKGNFDQISGVLNGQIGPENMKTSQIHTGFYLTATIPVAGLGGYAIAAMPVQASSGTIILTKVVAFGRLTAGAGDLTVGLYGNPTLAGALSGAGDVLLASFVLNPAAGPAGKYALETVAPIVSNVTSFKYLHCGALGGAGTVWDNYNVSGELVYTIQAV